MAIDFLYPQYEVVRNNDRCINCRACERQCANEVHFWDADNNRMLRSMVVGEKDDTVYIASEECAIRVIQPELDKLWAPKGGEPVIVNLKNGGNQ